MNAQPNQEQPDMEELKEIPKWAKRYAESRTLPMIVFHLIFIASFGMVFLGVYFFLGGRFILASLMMVAYVITLLYLFTRWDRHEARYYTKTGIPQSESIKAIRTYLPLPLIVCIIIHVQMEKYFGLPVHLGVPISALYVCPLLIFANWRWVRGSFIGYLWSALFAAWAIAIIFKVPVLTISGNGRMKPGDELYLAAPVTGLITGIIAYIYSRYALYRLKRASRSGLDHTGEPKGV